MRQIVVTLIPPSLSIILCMVVYMLYVLISMYNSIMCSYLYILFSAYIKIILAEKKLKIKIIN